MSTTQKSPEEVAQQIITDHAQRAPLAHGEARFTVRFDAETWRSLDHDERERWVDDVNDALADIAQVTLVESGHDLSMLD